MKSYEEEIKKCEKNKSIGKEEKTQLLDKIHIKYEEELLGLKIEDVVFPKYLYLS